jgi:hypothetical protein
MQPIFGFQPVHYVGHAESMLRCRDFHCVFLSPIHIEGVATIRELARKFWHDEPGQRLAEYALLLGLIVIEQRQTQVF